MLERLGILCRQYFFSVGLFVHVLLLAMGFSAYIFGPSETVRYLTVGAKSARNLTSTLSAKAIQALDNTPELAVAVDAFEFRQPAEQLPPKFGYGRVLKVGGGGQYQRPSDAAAVAKDGDVVEIAAGNYVGDSALWRASDLLIRAVGGVARIDLSGHRLVQEKAIWIIRGRNVRVENIEFTGARSIDRNGAGIRAEGLSLQVWNCYFHDNEAGLLAGRISDAEYLIERSEFARNGHPGGQSHQLYVGRIGRLTLRYNYFHNTVIGSAVKSRAQRSEIAYNRIIDGRDGQSNYSIDLSSGGNAVVVGNLIQQNQNTGNYTLVSYAAEGQSWPKPSATFAHNTLVNDRDSGRFIKNHGDFPINVYNNLFVGPGLPSEGPARLNGNVWSEFESLPNKWDGQFDGIAGSGENRSEPSTVVTDRANLDYRLKLGSTAIDAGVAMTHGGLEPVDFQYQHPTSGVMREFSGKAPDAGAFEYHHE